MAETPVTPPVDNITPVTPGKDTSEYAITKLSMILSMVAFVLGIVISVLSQVSTAFPNLVWVGTALSILGPIATVLAQLGYNKGRVLLKTSPYTK